MEGYTVCLSWVLASILAMLSSGAACAVSLASTQRSNMYLGLGTGLLWWLAFKGVLMESDLGTEHLW